MGLLRNRLLRRYGPLARLTDYLMITAAFLRLAHQMGWISDAQTNALGIDRLVPQRRQELGIGDPDLPLADLFMVGGAVWRLVRRRRHRRLRDLL